MDMRFAPVSNWPVVVFFLVAIAGAVCMLSAVRLSQPGDGRRRPWMLLWIVPLTAVLMLILTVPFYFRAARFEGDRQFSSAMHPVARHSGPDASYRWGWYNPDAYQVDEYGAVVPPVLSNGDVLQHDFADRHAETSARGWGGPASGSHRNRFPGWIGLLAVVVLLLAAIAAIRPVLLAAVGGWPSLRQTLYRATGLLWGVPVLFVLLVVLARYRSGVQKDTFTAARPTAIGTGALDEVVDASQSLYDAAMPSAMPGRRARTEAMLVRVRQMQERERSMVERQRNVAKRMHQEFLTATTDSYAAAIPETPEAVVAPPVSAGSTAPESGEESHEPDPDDTAAAAASSELPDWVSQQALQSGETVLVVVKSRQYSTIDEAERDALEQATRQIREDFRRFHKADSEWVIPQHLVVQQAVRRRSVETIERRTSTSQTAFEMKRVYLQVELSPAVRDQLFHHWREQVSQRRLRGLGCVAGLLTWMLGTASVYFRLDARTNGAYRSRLKLASVSLIVAGGLVAAAIV